MDPSMRKVDAARNGGNAALDKKGKMTRAVSMWLMVLVPCVLVYTGTARARDLPPLDVAETPPASGPSLFDPSSIGTGRAQYLGSPNAPESPTVIEPQRNAADSPFDASSVGHCSRAIRAAP